MRKTTIGWSYQEPQEVVASLIRYSGLKPRVVLVPVEKAVGLYTAEKIKALKDKPEWNQSLVDGYAVSTEDFLNTKNQSIALKIVEDVDPRNAEAYKLREKEAVYIDTGFPLPQNADAVIPVEKTIVQYNKVIIKDKPRKWMNVIKKASDFKKHEIIINEKEKITGLHTRVLLDAGIKKLRVYKPPVITIYPIGDELIESWMEPVRTGQVREGTRFIIMELTSNLACKLIIKPILPDNPESIINEIKKETKTRKPDIIVTISGVSIGRKDHSWRTLYKELKPRYYYRGVKIHPGRTNSGITLEKQVIINLPGFIQSSLAGIIFILRPLIRYMNGQKPEPSLPCQTMINKETVETEDKWVNHTRIRFVKKQGDNEAIILPPYPGPSVKPLINTDGITIIPPGKKQVLKGEKIKVYTLTQNNKECLLTSH